MKKISIFDNNYDYAFEDFEQDYSIQAEDDVPSIYDFYNKIDINYEDIMFEYNKQLGENIIAIADLGLWYGRRKGYQILSNNLNSIFQNFSCDCYQIFSDGYNIRFKGYHHDGSHYILFRQWKSNLTNEQKQHFLNNIYCGKVTKTMVSYYTKSILPDIAKISGIPCCKKLLVG